MSKKYKIRLATYLDLKRLETLFSLRNAKYFGWKNNMLLSEMFTDYQTYRFIAYDPESSSDFVAYSEFGPYPNIPGIFNDGWLYWLKHRFCIDLDLTLWNSMFLNFYIFNINDPDIFREVIHEFFYYEMKINYLLINKLPSCMEPDIVDYSLIEKLSKAYYPKDYNFDMGENTPLLYVIKRNSVIHLFQFRKALPEDNDDIIDIIDFEEPHLRIEQGDYFIAETLLETGEMSPQETIVVGEIKTEKAELRNDGFIWSTSKLDIEKLITNYDCERLGNLVKWSPKSDHKSKEFFVEFMETKPVYQLFKMLDSTLLLTTNTTLSNIGNIVDNVYYEREDLFSSFCQISLNFQTKLHYGAKKYKKLTVYFDVPETIDDKQNYNLNDVSDVFLVKKFNMHPHQSRIECCFYFLCAAFTVHSDRDYCVVHVPPNTKINNSLQELLTYFLPVLRRPHSRMTDDMFITHRSSVFGELSLYEFQEEDKEDIYTIFQVDHDCSNHQFPTNHKYKPETSQRDKKTNKLHDRLLSHILKSVLTNPYSEFTVWTIRCGSSSQPRESNTFVGFVVMRQFGNHSAISRQFKLPADETHLTNIRGEIIMLKVHPFFRTWSSELFRIVAMKTGFWDLYYLSSFLGLKLPNDMILHMMPVEPRRYRRHDFRPLQYNKYYRPISNSENLPKLSCVTNRITVFRHNLLPSKIFRNQNNLVIIGYSETSKAFLRSILFSWNNKKNEKCYNCIPRLYVTVITDIGIVEAEYDSVFHCNYCKKFTRCYITHMNSHPFIKDVSYRMDLRNWVHFMPGQVKHIDRKRKMVYLDEECTVNYDYLFLFCHTNYGIKNCVDLPINYAQLNSRLDKIFVYHKIQDIIAKNLENISIVIYGNNLAVYEFFNFILCHGCKPEHLIFVHPRRIPHPNDYNDPTVDTKLDDVLIEIIQDLGIQTHDSFRFLNWTLYKGTNCIKTLYFENLHKAGRSFKCDLFINFDENHLPYALEKVFEESGIDMCNGLVVVNSDLVTSDPHILAGGKHVVMKPFPSYQYVHVSDAEIAEKIVNFLKLCDDIGAIDWKFVSPNFFSANLPMGYKVVKVVLPKRIISRVAGNYFCKSMTTYDGDFCRVRLSTANIVEEIVYVTRKAENAFYYLVCFCGKHESLLNNLKTRWELKLISSFLEFFREPWTELITHELFGELHLKNMAALQSVVLQLQSNPSQEGQTEFHKGSSQILQQNLLSFLRKNRSDFVNEFALPEDWDAVTH